MTSRSKTFLTIAIIASYALWQMSGRINAYSVLILTSIGINIILAVSLNLINGYTGQFSLGHAGFMSVGAYTSAAVTMFLGPKIIGTNPGLPAQMILFLFALIAGGITAAIAGILVGAPSLRLKGDYLAIVTLGFGEIIRVIFVNIEPLGGALGLNGLPPYTNLFWVFTFVAICVYTVLTMVHSTYGRGFLAVHDDEIAAEAMGLNTTRYKIVAFVVGAFFAGIAGGLYGHHTLTIDPKGFGFMLSIEIVVMVILGGMGNTAGVIVAAILLTLLPQLLRTLAGYHLPFIPAPHNSLRWVADTRMILYSLLLIILMITRPQGLFSWQRKKKPILSA
jgi:branched-chain amino acid transport system permease protein